MWRKEKFPEKRDYSELGIIAQSFVIITEGENMTQSGGMEAVSEFGCRKLCISTKILCFGKPDENLQGFTVTKISMVKILFL